MTNSRIYNNRFMVMIHFPDTEKGENRDVASEEFIEPGWEITFPLCYR